MIILVTKESFLQFQLVRDNSKIDKSWWKHVRDSYLFDYKYNKNEIFWNILLITCFYQLISFSKIILKK